jgi:DNA-binding transcriptional LysR family regulator
MRPGLVEFLAVAREGSFTRAARTLGVSKSHVSKQVRLAEDSLGLQLLRRTTRSVSLTAQGQRYFERASRLVAELREVESRLQEASSARGTVRIGIPPGNPPLMAALAEVLVAHPDLRLIVSTSHAHVDVVGGGYDMVIRAGELPDSATLMARRVGDVQLGLYASPRYLEVAPAPTDLNSIGGHRWLMFSLHGTGRTEHVAQSPGLRALQDTILREGEVVMDSNSLAALFLACERGLGLCALPDYLARPAVADGRLVHLLPSAFLVQIPLWAVAPPDRFTSARVDAVVDVLMRALRVEG